MKISFRHILLAVLPAVVFSCDDSGKIAVEQSYFEVENTLLSVGPSEGDIEVSYSVKGPAAGLVAQVSATDSWIEVKGVDAGKIVLGISANDTGSDRLGGAVLSGNGVKDLTLHISQSKVSDSSPIHNSFTIDVTNVTSSSLDLEVNPVNPTMYYYTNLLTEATYSSLSETELIAAYAKSILEYSSSNNVEPQVFLYRGYFNTAESENVSLDLRDDTDYRVFAFCLDFDENLKPVSNGKIESVRVRTARASQVPMTFEFEKKSGATITVTPSTSAYSYVCGIASKEAWNEFTDKKDAAREYIDIAKQYNMFETILYYGTRDVDFTYLVENPGTYVVYAAGYRNSASDRGITTDIQYREFTF